MLHHLRQALQSRTRIIRRQENTTPRQRGAFLKMQIRDNQALMALTPKRTTHICHENFATQLEA